MITPREPAFTVGIEEEYLLVDRDTMALVNDPPASIMTECQRLTPSQVSPELLRSQIEVGTTVCASVSEARADLTRLRGVVIEAARREGLSPIAASTHPFGHWQEQKHTPVERYRDLTTEMQAAARRLLICGMHCACRHRRRRIAYRPDEPVALFCAASAGDERFFTVLGEPQYGFALLSADDFRCAAQNRFATTF